MKCTMINRSVYEDALGQVIDTYYHFGNSVVLWKVQEINKAGRVTFQDFYMYAPQISAKGFQVKLKDAMRYIRKLG